MLFEQILIAAVLVLAVIAPLMAIYSFKKGYELGVKDWNSRNPDEIKEEPTKKQVHFPSEPDKELQRYRKILENIENYDGTAANQKEIN